MIILGILLVVAIIAPNWNLIRRTYLGPGGSGNSLALLLSSIASFLILTAAFSARRLYVPDEGEMPPAWRSLQFLDALAVTIIFLAGITGFILMRAWIKRHPARRFGLVASASMLVIAVTYSLEPPRELAEMRLLSIPAILVIGYTLFICFRQEFLSEDDDPDTPDDDQ